jgi:hypothetical protein
LQVELEENQFDLVVIAQRLHALSPENAGILLRRGVAAVKPAGRLAMIDLFRGPTRPNVAEAFEALKLELDTRQGKMRTLEESQAALTEAGLQRIQFSFLAASRINLGLMVGQKAT